MEVKKRDQKKKAWTTPRLTTHGSVTAITLGCDKQLGETDGYTFMGLQIVCRS